MTTGFGGTATHDLARVGLTLAPPRRRGRAIARALTLVVAAFAAGVAADELVRQRAAPIVVHAAAPGPSAELVQLRQQLEQTKAGLRIADARGQELERQIDALNQKLTESEEQLTFFRKAREGKRP